MLVGVGLAVVAGAGIYGLTLPEPERPTDPFAELPIDHPLRQLVGVYEVAEIRFGSCAEPESVAVPEPARYFGVRAVFQEVVGQSCGGIEACRAMIDPRQPFRFSPTPAMPLDGEVEVSIEEVLGKAITISTVDDDAFTGRVSARGGAPGPDGTPRCVRIDAVSRVEPTDDGIHVDRQWLASDPVPDVECDDAPLRCVRAMQMSLRAVDR